MDPDALIRCAGGPKGMPCRSWPPAVEDLLARPPFGPYALGHARDRFANMPAGPMDQP